MTNIYIYIFFNFLFFLKKRFFFLFQSDSQAVNEGTEAERSDELFVLDFADLLGLSATTLLLSEFEDSDFLEAGDDEDEDDDVFVELDVEGEDEVENLSIRSPCRVSVFKLLAIF